MQKERDLCVLGCSSAGPMQSRQGRTAESENVQQYFGTLYASIITLFRHSLGGFRHIPSRAGAVPLLLMRSISNGITWEKAANSLEPISTFWVQVFHFYVAFCSFALLNAIPACLGHGVSGILWACCSLRASPSYLVGGLRVGSHLSTRRWQ